MRSKYVAAVGYGAELKTQKQFDKWKKGFENDLTRIGSVQFGTVKLPWFWILPPKHDTYFVKNIDQLRRAFDGKLDEYIKEELENK